MPEPVILALGAKRYELVIDNAAVFAFEEERPASLGPRRGFFRFMAEIGRMVRQDDGAMEAEAPAFGEIVFALWCAARAKHPKLPLEKLRGEVNFAQYFSYVALLITAFAASMPEIPAEPADEGSVPLVSTPNSGA